MVSASELGRAEQAKPSWVWHGFLIPGKVTVLTSQWKSGKTTLVSLLLARLQEGGQLAGLPVTAGKAVVVSEESREDWDARCQRLGISRNVTFLCRPFPSKPTRTEWLALIEALHQARRRQGVDLVVIDPLASFLPGRDENTAGTMLEHLLPLQHLASAGVSVLLLHHPRKGKTLAGQAARGSGALAGFVDISLEMSWYTEAGDSDRRRTVRAYSRHQETSQHLVIELSADGRDYLVRSVLEHEEGFEEWETVKHLLEDADRKLTRLQILERWPRELDRPDKGTLWRWLDRAAKQGLLCQEGSGRSDDPFRYFLAERLPLLHPGERATREELQAWNNRYMSWVLDNLNRPGKGGAAGKPQAQSETV